MHHKCETLTIEKIHKSEKFEHDRQEMKENHEYVSPRHLAVQKIREGPYEIVCVVCVHKESFSMKFYQRKYICTNLECKL